ncbi:MAG TPA: hypothetical protein DET40_24910 [Lentisphaeria bacterium]|nr:MAG: hypothetical protein A2X45_19045 [Lentisphaerae bacterium GWF2_50_93]HCE46800.1 hypothetical protein [Lentisphaeria bacterium]
MTWKRRQPRILGTIILVIMSISVSGQNPSADPGTPSKRDISEAQISVLINKRNWEKILEHGTAAVEPLIKALKDNDPVIRAETAEVLGGIGDKRALDPLIGMLKDGNPDVRQQAVKALGRMGSKRAVEPLAACLKDPSRDIRLEAVEALKSLADEWAFRPLVKSLKDSDAVIRKETVKALLLTGGARAVEPFLEYLEDPAAKSKVEVIRALGVLGDKRALEQLVICLKDKDPVIRMWSVEALRRIGDERAVGPLKKCLDDSDPGVREKTAAALKKFKVEVKAAAVAVKPVEKIARKVDKKTDAPPAPPAQIPAPAGEQPAAKPEATPVDSVGEVKPSENKKQPVEVRERDSSSWWLYGIIATAIMILAVAGLSISLAGRKTSAEISGELEKLSSRIREISRRKTNDSVKDAALNLLEAHATAFVHFPSDTSSGEEKKKYLADMDDSIAKISEKLGSWHRGIRLLRKMRKIVKNAISMGILDSQHGAGVSGMPESSRKDEMPSPPGNIKFKAKEKNSNGTYEFYTADSRNEALEFLRKSPVKEEKKYLIVDTPEGTFGKDLVAIFKEAKSDIMEYGRRPPLPQLEKSLTHCVKCGYPVLPAGAEVDESVERILLEQSKPQKGIMSLKKQAGAEEILIEQLKKHGVGLFCSKCPTAWCPFCANQTAPTTCGICASEMLLYRKK